MGVDHRARRSGRGARRRRSSDERHSRRNLSGESAVRRTPGPRAVVRAGCAGGRSPRRRLARRPRDLLGRARPPRSRARRRARRPRGRARRPGRAPRPARPRPHRRRTRLLAGEASVVVADPGLGAAGLARALRGAHPAHVVGALPGLALAAALGVPGSRIAAGPVPPVLRRALGGRSGWPSWPAAAGRCSTPEPRSGRGRAGRRGGRAVHLGRDGAGEGRRRHRQASAQLAALRGAYGITGDDRLVAAFPPFALYGPALGIPSACRRCGNRAR